MMWGKDREMPTTTAETEPAPLDPHEEVRTIQKNFTTMSLESAGWFTKLSHDEQLEWMGKMYYVVEARKRGRFDEFNVPAISYDEQRKAESARKHKEFARYLVQTGRVSENLDG